MNAAFLFLFIFTFLACSGKKVSGEKYPERRLPEINRASVQPIPALPAAANEFAGKLFLIGPDMDRKSCQVLAECDCCASDLLFLSATEFVTNSHCEGSESVAKGTYSIKGGKLILRFDPRLVEYTYNWEREVDTTAIPYFLTTKKFQIRDLVYSIEKCQGTTYLSYHPGPEEGPAMGAENKTSSNAEQIQLLKQKGIWAKLEMK